MSIRVHPWFLIFVVFLASLIGVASGAAAAEVEFSIAPRETEVGLPVTLTIEIINASQYSTPKLPDIAGAVIQEIGGGQESTMTTIVNGRTTTRTSRRLTYRITPSQVGTLTIPSFTVEADGQAFTSQATPIIVGQSSFSVTDLLFVDIHSPQQSIFLGQPLNATLRIWIRPYQNKEFNVRINADQMWGMVDFEASTWGDFTESLQKLRDPFGRWNIGMAEVLREDSEGNPRSYYLYEVPATIWPQQAGSLAIQPPNVIVNYPARIGRQRDFFGSSSLTVTETRPVSATATLPPVEIKSPPAEGQPPTFNGAVGRFDISVSAKPTEVSVGDPITLTIRIIDQSNGEARLDLVPPPPLDRVPDFAQNFKIPSDPLAGTVTGNLKTFTQTVRANNTGVSQIPPVPLTFFDPSSETYVTRSSDPIPITVKAGSSLAAQDVVQSNGFTAPAASTELKTVAGGILANYTESELLLANHELKLGSVAIGAIIAPPLLFLMAWVGRFAVLHRTRNEAFIRRRTARKRAAASLRGVRTAEASEQARTVIAALSQYVNDRLSLSNRSYSGGELVEIVRQRRASNGQITELEQLMDECDQQVYARGVQVQSESNCQLADRALACIDHLERNRIV